MAPDMGSAARAEAFGPQTTSRPLRAWQQAALEQYEQSFPKDFLVTATPGAGKTTFALTLAARLLQRREIAAVRAVVENLPEPFRETVVLRELEELSYKEIAALMDVPIGTVMSRLARARKQIREYIIAVPGQKRIVGAK